jgi:hypothetical protein
MCPSGASIKSGLIVGVAEIGVLAMFEGILAVSFPVIHAFKAGAGFRGAADGFHLPTARLCLQSGITAQVPGQIGPHVMFQPGE